MTTRPRLPARTVRRCWRDAGLTDEGARRADAILAPMVKLVEQVGNEIARIVLREAQFRVEQLPKLTEAFREGYFANEYVPARSSRKRPAKTGKGKR